MTGAPSSTPRVPAVEALDALDPASCAIALGPLFENAPRFLARLCAARPFGDEDGLFAIARAIAHAMPEPEQLELIDAHPRLGAPPASLSSHSFVEQGHDREPAMAAAAAEQARIAADQAQIAAELSRLNAAYEARFGFRYCVFVAGRTRAALLPAFDEAVEADRDAELARALDAVVDIAADRYRKNAPPQ